MERCRREEAFGRERRLCYSQKHSCSHGRPAAALLDLGILLLKAENIHHLAREHGCISCVVYLALLEHLANNYLQVLVGDFNTLHSVNELYFSEQVCLNSFYALNLENIRRIDGAFCQLVARLDSLAFLNLDSGAIRYGVDLLLSQLGSNRDLALFLRIADGHSSAYLTDDSLTARLSRFEKLFDSGQTLSNIVTRDAAGVEGSHRKLRTRLADSLRRNNADRLADVYFKSRSHIGAVAFSADAVFALARERCTYVYARNARVHYFLGYGRGDKLVHRDENLARIRICYILRRNPAADSVFQRFYYAAAVAKIFYANALNLFAQICKAVLFTNYDIVRYVYQTAR